MKKWKILEDFPKSSIFANYQDPDWKAPISSGALT